MSKRALITYWIQNPPFHYGNVTYQHNLYCSYTDKVTCNTNKATRSKTKRLTCTLEAMKFCHSMLRATPAVPLNFFFRLRCCMLIFFHVKLKQQRLDQTQKRCRFCVPFQNSFKIRLRRETNWMHAQARSTNQHLVIMNALFLSQSAFSKFALHVISVVIMAACNCSSTSSCRFLGMLFYERVLPRYI